MEAAIGDGGGNLVSDGKGNWSFAVSKALGPGSYDVVVETADKVGRKSFDQTRFEINIKAPAVQESQQPAPVQPPESVAAEQSPAAQPAPPAYDCAGAVAEISTAFPIRFAFNDTQLKPPLDAAMKQYAALFKDQRCATMKAEVVGHTDFYGPRLSNQALSEARAQTVVSALVAAGVDAPRLSTQGFSELMPADTEKNAAARQRNRRVEITLVKQGK